MGKLFIATLAAAAVLIGGAAPVQAQASASLSKSKAEKGLVAKVRAFKGTAVQATCRRPRHGRARCAVLFAAADGRLCRDDTVNVVRRHGRFVVRNMEPKCTAAPPAASAAAPAA